MAHRHLHVCVQYIHITCITFVLQEHGKFTDPRVHHGVGALRECGWVSVPYTVYTSLFSCHLFTIWFVLSNSIHFVFSTSDILVCNNYIWDCFHKNGT